VTVDGVS
jgi:hypothetical protein